MPSLQQLFINSAIQTQLTINAAGTLFPFLSKMQTKSEITHKTGQIAQVPVVQKDTADALAFHRTTNNFSTSAVKEGGLVSITLGAEFTKPVTITAKDWNTKGDAWALKTIDEGQKKFLRQIATSVLSVAVFNADPALGFTRKEVVATAAAMTIPRLGEIAGSQAVLEMEEGNKNLFLSLGYYNNLAVQDGFTSVANRGSNDVQTTGKIGGNIFGFDSVLQTVGLASGVLGVATDGRGIAAAYGVTHKIPDSSLDTFDYMIFTDPTTGIMMDKRIMIEKSTGDMQVVFGACWGSSRAADDGAVLIMAS
jgi:hypothetical protein